MKIDMQARPTAATSPRRFKRFFIALSIGALLVVAVTLPQGMTAPMVERAHSAYLTGVVKRADLEVVLAQRGILDSARNIVVSSECEWPVRIIELIPEGTWVEQGQVVVQLDSSELEQRLKEREIQLIDAHAALIQAQEVYSMQELENQSALAKAKLALQLAQLDLEKYRQGDFPKAEKEARAAVALAKEDVSRATERYSYVARMVRKGYESPVTLEKERLSVLKYENQLSKAQQELDLLLQHTQRRTLTELEALRIRAQSELDRVEMMSHIALLNRQVQVHSRQKRYDATLEYVERVRKSIAACTIRAPKTGEIIYANEGSVRNEILMGETIRNRQDVVRIPDLSQMDVKLRIHESMIEGIRQGLNARIRLDAYPNVSLTGRVHSVSRLPTTGSGYSSDLREYDATVRINLSGAPADLLKPGLTAQVGLLVDRRDDCLQIPAQSLVNVAGRRMAFVSTSTGIEPRELEIGIASDTAVEVISGLQEAERVLLSPRTNCSELIAGLQEQYASETNVADIGG